MKVLITGASSGMGREFARYFDKLDYEVVLVARRKDKLLELQKELKKATVIIMDLSIEENIYELFNKTSDIDILINNAGFGLFGEFTNSPLERELEMINTNIKAVHILTKLYLNEMQKKNKGYILNVASSAAFMPSGPLMSTYYASKGYVLKLTEAINTELRINKSNIYIGALCPGPVNTEFNKVANVTFGMKALEADYVVKYTIRKMFKKKMIIIPGFSNKLVYIFRRFLPIKTLNKMVYKIQKKKEVK